MLTEKQILQDFENIERELTVDLEIERAEKVSSEAETEEDTVKSSSKTEVFMNRVYEIRIQQVEEEIISKRNKILDVINKRKMIMEDLVKSKKKEIEANVNLKGEEMRYSLTVFKDKESQIFCSLKNLYHDIIELKKGKEEVSVSPKDVENYLAKEFLKAKITVKLENLFDVAISLKEEEIEILQWAKLKQMEKNVSLMKKKIEKVILDSKKRLEKELQIYRKQETIRAMEYASLKKSSATQVTLKEYNIPYEEIFPDVKLFTDFLNTFALPFIVKTKQTTFLSENLTYLTGTMMEKLEGHIPLAVPQSFALQGVVGHLLKLYEGEIQTLTKVFGYIEKEFNAAAEYGFSLTFNNEFQTSKDKKEIAFDISAVLQSNTSLLMLGSYLNSNCDIAFNLGCNFGAVYFEETEKISKWTPLFSDLHEMAIDVGLQDLSFDENLDSLATEFDRMVSTSSNCSLFETLIGDFGLLEQIRVTILELHHLKLVCKQCNLQNLSEEVSLPFETIQRFLSSNDINTKLESIPVESGHPKYDDALTISIVIDTILTRGALLTSIFLSSLLEKINKKCVVVLIHSFFIKECLEYREKIEKSLATLSPEKEVEFIFCDSTNCDMGAALAAAVENHQQRNCRKHYLRELQRRVSIKNTLFSVKSFLQLLNEPELTIEALELAHLYYQEVNFVIPLSVVWAYYFINENYSEADEIFKTVPISFKKVNFIICEKICTSENFEMCKKYLQILEEKCSDRRTIIKAYRLIFDLLVYRNKYEESINMIEDLMKMNIPLSKLKLPTLNILHAYCKRMVAEKTVIQFPLPLKISGIGSA
nr:uncharacterized protein LOC107438252 isoform X2 [Parasteatoda tepidariorum]